MIFFISFLLLVTGAFLFYAPGWGFMDDLSCLQQAGAFWSGKLSFTSMIFNDIHSYGRFRPIYHLWVILAYWIKYPLLIYLLVFLAGSYVLLLWGQLISRVLFKDPAPAWVQWVFPLGFFLFPAFWNIFMYISVQEKFVFIFGSLSLVALFKSYEAGSSRQLIMALVLAMAAVLGKETGLVLIASYAGYAFLDLVLFKRNERLSQMLLGASLIIGLAYVIFIKSILGGYTASYKMNMSIGILIGRISALPGDIKLILALAGISFVIFIWDTLRGRKWCDPFFVIFPLWVFIYVFLLLPWGFPAYLLAPLGPFVMVCFYFLIVRLSGQQDWLLGFFRVALMAAIMLALGLDIVPKISKMADKRKVVEAVKYLDQKAPGQFFYPGPFLETAANLQGFSSAQVTCVGTINASSLVKGENNYLAVNDEAAPVFLDGVDVGRELYHNGTWGIWLLHEAPDVHKEFRLLLVQNILQKIKNMIRRT